MRLSGTIGTECNDARDCVRPPSIHRNPSQWITNPWREMRRRNHCRQEETTRLCGEDSDDRDSANSKDRIRQRRKDSEESTSRKQVTSGGSFTRRRTYQRQSRRGSGSKENDQRRPRLRNKRIPRLSDPYARHKADNEDRTQTRTFQHNSG